MYCPNCGNQNSENQRFCKSCGLKLPAVSQIPGGETSDSKSVNMATVNFNPQQSIWHNPVIYGLFIVAIGMFMVIAGRKTFGDKTISDIGTVMALIGVGLIGLKGLFLVLQQAGIEPFAKAGTHLQSSQRQVSNPETPALQPGEPLSVIEHTTRNLDSRVESFVERPRNTQPTLK